MVDTSGRGRMVGEMCMNVSNSISLHVVGKVNCLRKDAQRTEKKVQTTPCCPNQSPEGIEICRWRTQQKMQVGAQNTPREKRLKVCPFHEWSTFWVHL